jgi:colanic acid biosynthesis glycosyl transferase WcaI
MSISRKPRVLYLTYHLPRENEPGAFRPWMEARLLQMAGYEVTVVTCSVQYMTGQRIVSDGSWCSEELIDGIRVLRTWGPADYRRSLSSRLMSYFCFAFLAGLASVARVGKVDFLFASTTPITLMPVNYLTSLIKRAHMVLDHRDLYPETLVALGVLREGLWTRILFSMQQAIRRRATGILAATPGIKRSLVEYGFSQEKVRLLYNADVFLHKQNNDGRNDLDLRQLTRRPFLVGYAGGLGQANDIPTLLRAAAELRNLEDVGIVIIGSGENRGTYIEYCCDHGLDNVHLVPAVPRSEARRLLRQLDVCVCLYRQSKFFEGTLASKIFDYQGLGKPIVFCGMGDTAELLRVSGSGLTVDAGDSKGLARAIRRLRDDESLRRQLGDSGLSWFEENVRVDAACNTIKQVMQVAGQ